MSSDTTLPGLARSWIGHWLVSRRVNDLVGSASCVFSGAASITEDGFSEDGEIRIGNRLLPASRTYRLETQNRCVHVFRGDDLFIRLGGQPSQIVHHRCGADSYVGRFLFRNRDEWVEVWRVKGPRKNYASIGRFNRLRQPD